MNNFAEKSWRNPALLVLMLLLSACVTNSTTPNSTAQSSIELVCREAHQWRGQIVGDGHCVSFIKRCTKAPRTANWRPGEIVQGRELVPGTIIATFDGQNYPSRTGYHAAIYISQDKSGIWVWDQWQGKPVHQRLIRWHNRFASNANKGSSYRVVLVEGTKKSSSGLSRN